MARVAQPLPPGFPGPGCSQTNESYKMTAVAFVATPIGFGGGGVSKDDEKSTIACNSDYQHKQLNSTKNLRSSSVNSDTLMMSKNALKSISESTNQMIVNSISSQTSNASQTAKITQSIEIAIKGVAGDVKVSNISNKSTIKMENMAEISLDAFDNVKNDLATSVLQEFKNNTNQESMSTLNANLQTTLANQTDAAIKMKSEAEVLQEKKSQFPGTPATEIVPKDMKSNVKIDQTSLLENTEINDLSNKYTNILETERIMETHINNAVTQNFTKESLSQLSQYLEQNQNIKITIEDIGGNVEVGNIENATNIVLRQTLSSKMNVGNAIANTVINTLGIQTDDTVVTKNIQDSGLTSKTDLRNGMTSTTDMETKMKYTQKMTEDFGFGSCGSISLLSSLPCIICIVCVLSFGSGGMSLISSIASSESSSDKLQANEEIDDSDSSKSPGSSESSESIESSVSPGSSDSSGSTEFKGTSVGGYYYFD